MIAASAPETPGSTSQVTCCFTTPRRRQRFVRNEAIAAQLCKLCLSPLVTALSARASCGGPALEESAWPSSVDTLGFDASFERCIRHNTPCLTLHTTPVRLRSVGFPMTRMLRKAASPSSTRAASQSFVEQEAQEATSVPAAANSAARRPNLAMRVTSLLLLLRHAAALSAPRPRVAVVGPAGDTVADAVAVRLNDADVTRCVNENAGYVDAAVVCADGGEEKLSTLAERCAGARNIVLVAPAGAADEDDGFSLPNPLKLLDQADTNDVDEVAERCRNGGARVAVVRHGPLFGAGARDADVVAFSQGLRRAPTLVDDFGRRGARVVSVQQNEDKQDQFLSSGTWLGLGDMDAARSDVQAREGKAEPQTPARRGAVADAAAATIRRFQDLPGSVEFEVRSGSGSTSPSPEEWDAMVLSVCRDASSPEAMNKQLLPTKVWDPAQLGDWLRTEWGPKALMSVDATLAIRGADPWRLNSPP